MMQGSVVQRLGSRHDVVADSTRADGTTVPGHAFAQMPVGRSPSVPPVGKITSERSSVESVSASRVSSCPGFVDPSRFNRKHSFVRRIRNDLVLHRFIFGNQPTGL